MRALSGGRSLGPRSSSDMLGLRVIQGGMSTEKNQSSSSPSPAPANKRDLLVQWRNNAERAATTHRHESRKHARWIGYLGVPVIGCTVASAVLSAVHADFGKLYDLTVVSLGTVGAILAGIQTFLGADGKRSASHQAAAAYSAVRRRIEVLLAKDSVSDEEIESIKQELDNLGKGSPLASEESFQKHAEKTASTMAHGN